MDTPTQSDLIKAELPRVTLAIICYNQERYIEEAMKSAMAQDYENLQILVCDDASGDRTAEIVKECLASVECKHDCSINVHEKNTGIAGNVNSAFQLAEGELVVLQAGDDLSEVERCSKLVDCWKREEVSCIVSNVSLIDEKADAYTQNSTYRRYVEGIDYGVKVVKEEATKMPKFLGCSSCYHREVFSQFGALASEVVLEDQVLTMRALMLDGIYYEPEKLLRYRIHNENMHAFTSKQGQGERKAKMMKRLVDARAQILKDDQGDLSPNLKQFLQRDSLKLSNYLAWRDFSPWKKITRMNCALSFLVRWFKGKFRSLKKFVSV